MSALQSLMVRAKYSSSVSGYTAATLMPGKDRATASSTTQLNLLPGGAA